MKIAIMQPYFFPYLGYWQLINAVDKFVVYDNIEYTKKGWINRNQILINGEAKMFTIPLKKDSDYLFINQRFRADISRKEMEKILGRIKFSYAKAPFFTETYPLVEKCFMHNSLNLFDFIFYSIKEILNHLKINTKIIMSSALNIDESLKGEDKVLDICKSLDTSLYFNAIGGQELYNKARFKQNGFELKFIKMNEIRYSQFSSEFVPFLSIIDVMMFNSVDQTRNMLKKYSLI